MLSINDNFWENKRVFITGHSGFKGSWLALWLKELGANVVGFSLHPPSQPNHFQLLDLNMPSISGDIRDIDAIRSALKNHRPEIVFHLAAQPLVRYSYNNPVETLETNIMGTINLFEACRHTASVRVIVNITSDKCYENKEWFWGYRENDPMGGYDPYSASKGCAEIVTSSYRNSFFNLRDYGRTHNVLLASVRAGNVIGGGDWAADRLMPDIMKAASKNEKVIIRNPRATRPWQHVLEPLSGYLMLGQKLLEGRTDLAEGWNFGPDNESTIDVETVLMEIKKEWDKIEYEIKTDTNAPHEAGLLKLDCSKAHAILRWKPLWNIEKTLAIATRWYKEFYENGRVLSIDNLKNYMIDRTNKRLVWT
ncbi:MAG: CDP-glucose 4,6-dehydratase [Syntrophus sp. (in: bacteria)]|nr:CDP-glucose 4,6-dehydratase [Syntrophus sp. (in: bacteria)]